MTEHAESTDDILLNSDFLPSPSRPNAIAEVKPGKGAPDLISFHEPDSPLVEQYKTLFTEIDKACQANGKRIIVLTSATTGEGKTTTVSNLAVVAARNFGRKCLLIDAHLKNPNIAALFRLERGLGLIDVMMNRRSLEKVWTPSPIENLTLLPTGHHLGKRAEDLNVDSLKDVFAKIRGEYYNVLWNEDKDSFTQMEQQVLDLFDYIFIDAPPIFSLEMGIIAEAADAILLVVRAGSVSQRMVKQAMERLNSPKVIGSILNFARMAWPLRAYTYGYNSQG